ncbi:hypothetical protein TNCV_3037571 [Trichonephila clavipes]|nr:hypothetical protein TNCV_3037571 [Trichonephila clavipes]
MGCRQTWENSVRFPSCCETFPLMGGQKLWPFFPMPFRKLKKTPVQCAFVFSRIYDDSASDKIELTMCTQTDSGNKRPTDKRSKRNRRPLVVIDLRDTDTRVRELKGFRTEDVSNLSHHPKGYTASELTRTRCGITEIERRTVEP